jgi:hypothetical protein
VVVLETFVARLLANIQDSWNFGKELVLVFAAFSVEADLYMRGSGTSFQIFGRSSGGNFGKSSNFDSPGAPRATVVISTGSDGVNTAGVVSSGLGDVEILLVVSTVFGIGKVA